MTIMKKSHTCTEQIISASVMLRILPVWSSRIFSVKLFFFVNQEKKNVNKKFKHGAETKICAKWKLKQNKNLGKN